jgi:hypothetical protein
VETITERPDPMFAFILEKQAEIEEMCRCYKSDPKKKLLLLEIAKNHRSIKLCARTLLMVQEIDEKRYLELIEIQHI